MHVLFHLGKSLHYSAAGPLLSSTVGHHWSWQFGRTWLRRNLWTAVIRWGYCISKQIIYNCVNIYDCMCTVMCNFGNVCAISCAIDLCNFCTHTYTSHWWTCFNTFQLFDTDSSHIIATCLSVLNSAPYVACIWGSMVLCLGANCLRWGVRHWSQSVATTMKQAK